MKVDELKKAFKNLIKNGFNPDMLSRRFKKISESPELIETYYNLFDNFKYMNVLDIGCFSGFFSFMISNVADYVIGIDKENTPIQFANNIKDRLNISNVNFMNTYIGNFVQKSYHTELNINSLFIHKCVGQMVKSEKEELYSIAPSMKLIIITGKYLNDKGDFEVEEFKRGLYILRNRVIS